MRETVCLSLLSLKSATAEGRLQWSHLLGFNGISVDNVCLVWWARNKKSWLHKVKMFYVILSSET